LRPAIPFLQRFAAENLNGNYLYLHPLNISKLLGTRVTDFALKIGDGQIELLIA
jgi:hypothetical protein